MQRLVSHIEYLLDRHECVIIPGVGAFISSYRPASIDATGLIIMPPRYELSFNAELRHDDGLLASSYSRALSVSYTAACSLISRDVELLKSSLADAGEVTLGRLGRFTLEDKTTIVYHHNDSVLWNDGLQNVSLKADTEENVVSETKKAPILLEAPARYPNTIHRIMRYAAMLVILLGVGIVLSTPLTVDPDSETVVQASLSPVSVVASLTEPETRPELLIAQPVQQETEISVPHDNYCLVIASLANRAQAEQFMAEAGNDAAGMFESDGRYRVYAATGPDIASVRNEQFEDRYPGAWVCAMTK